MSSIMRKTVDSVNHGREVTTGDVLESILAVMDVVRAHRMRALREGGHGITHLEGLVLGFFARHPGATQSELTAHLGRDKGQLARLVAGLRERGLLEPCSGQSDRRSLRLQPTSEAREILQALHRQTRKLSQLAVAGLDDKQRQRLVDLLARVRASLETLG
jgi:DNA-binding MarR family transcriptional regulator